MLNSIMRRLDQFNSFKSRVVYIKTPITGLLYYKPKTVGYQTYGQESSYAKEARQRIADMSDSEKEARMSNSLVEYEFATDRDLKWTEPFVVYSQVEVGEDVVFDSGRYRYRTQNY